MIVIGSAAGAASTRGCATANRQKRTASAGNTGRSDGVDGSIDRAGELVGRRLGGHSLVRQSNTRSVVPGGR